MDQVIQDSLLGALVADAVAMPVHWYYDRQALDRDYGCLTEYRAPKNPHPDSILWRSSYTPKTPKAEILHDQAQYWGQKGIHYHQSLNAGENTINFLLGIQLYRSIVRAGEYDPDVWLSHYVRLMQTPGWHRDTYLEEYHRGFFDQYADGKELRKCSVEDLHIGGLVPVPFLLGALDTLTDEPSEIDLKTVRTHIALTHHHRYTLDAAEAFAAMLIAVTEGQPVREVIAELAQPWTGQKALEKWSQREDRDVVGRELTPACYLPESFTAALHFVWKYHDDFSEGILANARCGGDNCHRGVVVGSLLAAANGIPEAWLRGLESMEHLRCDTLDPLFGRG